MRGRRPWNRAPPRRDTRAPGMPQRHQETGIRARTEHNHLNTPGNLKHLKSVVLQYGPRTRMGSDMHGYAPA